MAHTDKERLDWFAANPQNLLTHRNDDGTFGWLTRGTDELPWPEPGDEEWQGDLRMAIDSVLDDGAH